MHFIKEKIVILLGLLLMGNLIADAQWKPVGDRIKTGWAEKVNPSLPLPEYPRPQLARSNNWQNLNGLWQYAILPKGDGETIPINFDGEILVPFAVESSLSGVGKSVGKDSVLWYSRLIDVPAKMRKGKVVLHFGAIDWASKIFVNGQKVGEHEGGHTAFSLDITSALKKGTKQLISVHVWDPTDEGVQPTGKQVVKPRGIWYTPVTGIWQTVWLETVPVTYIKSTKQTPNIDKEELQLSVAAEDLQVGDEIIATVWDGAKSIVTQVADEDNNIVLAMPGAKRWSPASPFLYDLKIAVKRKGKIIDEVQSYFGMRKISMAPDANGIQRMMLNDEILFQYGPLDQGWWPDGLYTAPTDEALKFDIEETKALGFNMIRKHIKTEPARWYYHCDKLGVLVWQDMPSGDLGGNAWSQQLRVKMPPGKKVDKTHDLVSQVPGLVFDKKRSPESDAIFRKEWKAIMEQLHNSPSIVVWVPFNESWGQFKTKEIVEWTIQYDSSRLVNTASGGNFFVGLGPILDLHYYRGPAMPDPTVYGANQVLVLGEFGGLGLPIEGHLWENSPGNWGYGGVLKSTAELSQLYTDMVKDLTYLITYGLSAAVYTQTTDVEIETNGLFTYDRKVLKFDKSYLYQLHQLLYDSKLVK